MHFYCRVSGLAILSSLMWLQSASMPLLAQPACDPADVWNSRYGQQTIIEHQTVQTTIEVRFVSVSESFFERIGVDFDFDVNSAPCDPEFDATNSDFPFGENPTPLPNPFQTWNLFGLPATTGADFRVFQLNSAAEKDNLLKAIFTEPGTSVRRFDWDAKDGEVVILDDPINEFGLFGLLRGTGPAVTLKHGLTPDKMHAWVSAQPVLHGVTPEGGFSGLQSADEVVEGDAEAEFPDNPKISARSAASVVMADDGQTLVIAGVRRQPQPSDGLSRRLSQVPFVSRLFRNVGISNNDQHLMIMVTPKIIIQEED